MWRCPCRGVGGDPVDLLAVPVQLPAQSRPDLDFREFPSPTVRLPAYTVADLSGSVRVLRTGLGRGLSLTARVENLFDREYEEILYYRAPGRTILVGARAEFALVR